MDRVPFIIRESNNILKFSGINGLTGESGGNVHIVFNEGHNVDRWTILNVGGRGGPGQDGGNGSNGRDGKDATPRMTLEEFQNSFPVCSIMSQAIHLLGMTDIKKFTRVLDTLVPSSQRTKDVTTKYLTSRFIQGHTTDGRFVTVSIKAHSWIRDNNFYSLLVHIQGNFLVNGWL
jgi:hypothetical protein